MGKIKHLFLLCTLFTLSVITTKAQTAVDYQTSTAPSNGSFAADTHWFTIYLRGTYLSVENVDADSYLYGGNGFNTINNTIDKGLWCVVGDETKGYKFYNKSIGPTKVLAINYVSDDTGGAARAKMVDASTENATTGGADNWLTTFNLYKNVTSNVGAYSVSVKGLTNYYLNQRGSYLAFWINPKAKEEVGSSFYFYDKSSYVGPAKTLVTTYTGKTGGIYQPTEEELSVFSSKIPTDYTWDNLASVWTSVNNAIATFKAAIDKHTPTIGKRYLIKNSHNSKYIVPNIIPGSALNVQTGDITKDAVWTLEAGDTEGTYKLKNAWSGLYINGVKANTTGTDLKVVTANVYNNTVAIGTGTYEESQQTWLHGNQDPLILWTASAGASRWTLTEVSDADFNTYAALPNSYISTLVNNAKNFLGVGVTEKETFQNNPTYENYLTYYNKVKAGTDNQYVRLQCAKSGNNCFMGLNDAYTEANALVASTQKTNLSNIWKLVPVEGEEFCYKLMNANTGTYITNIQNAVNGANNPNPTLTDESNGYKFTFTLKNETNGNWNVIDQNNNQLNAETDGRINYWTHGGNDGWWIFKATDIEVALHELGDASYASLYLPYSISAVSNAEAYVANNAAVNNTLVMQTTSDGGFDANQGVVLVSDTKASTATLTLGENTNKSLLRGTSQPITLTDETRANYLVFGPKDGAENTVGFWTPAASLTSIAANRAYYLNEGGQQAVRLVFNGSVIEGIDHVVDVNDNVNAPIYDLMGRRVNNTMKHGVYIQNGKKMIVK
uniref:hypothetical protein n=1 Tax=Alloprevotella sp. TaxID=1872471 RepID=UPI0040293E57